MADWSPVEALSRPAARGARLSATNAAGLVAACLVAGTVVFQATDRQPPSSFTSVQAMQRTVPAGGTLLVEFKIERLRDCAVDVDKSIFDGAGLEHRFAVDVRPGTGPVGTETWVVPMVVPASARVGEAHARFTIAWYCNELQRVLKWPIRPYPPVGDILFQIVPPTNVTQQGDLGG